MPKLNVKSAIHAINYNRSSFPADWTKMHRAAATNYVTKLTQLLTKTPFNLNGRDSVGQTPLHIAVLYNNKEATAKLIELGANINLRDNRGQAPIHFATFNRNVAIVNLLVAHGANVNLLTKESLSALEIAQVANAKHIKEILKKAGAKDLIDTFETSSQRCPLWAISSRPTRF